MHEELAFTKIFLASHFEHTLAEEQTKQGATQLIHVVLLR